MNKNEVIAKIIGEPSDSDIELQYKKEECSRQICNLVFEGYNSPLRYINGELKLIKGK